MSVISKTTIKEQLYSELKQRILDRKYMPGDKLVIDRLVSELAVSNTPIREALSMLESDGLVVTTPNSGIRVVEMNAAILNDVSQAAYVMLAGGYDLCRRLGLEKALIELMRDRLERQLRLLGKGDSVKFLQAAIVFDKSFIDVTGNKRLVTMFDRQAEVFFLAVAGRNRDARQIEENTKDHRDMLEAVNRDDARALEEILARHYRQNPKPVTGVA
ncbi:MAG: GntR family transcriptional regulator [Deltaproteobacteria bacterium]|nr:GntR family transcriptional regulator [Deltaproteobacteria bacterium]